MQKVINKLRYFDENFPRETIEECVNRQGECTEILLEELDKLIVCKTLATENDDYMLHLYVIYLLAQFKEKRAFRRIIDLISFTSDEVEGLFGDVLTEDLPAILYSTYDGDLGLLKGAIENPTLNLYARGSVLFVYGKLYSDGVVSKDECIAYLKKLIYDDAYSINPHIGTDIQDFVITRHIFEMIDDIQYLYDQDCIDEGMFGKYDDFIDCIYSYDDDIDRVAYIDDTIQSMSWWACFKQTGDQKRKMEARMKQLIASRGEDEKPKKVGRNEPCPCGSGKKHKKCCLGKELTPEEEKAEEERVWLKYYPDTEGEKAEGRVRITDIYDEESIEIDKLVYLASHCQTGSFWDDEDEIDESAEISYLTTACEKFIVKCKKEEIDTFDVYDSKYKIHYRSREWIEMFKNLMVRNEHEYYFGDLLESVNDMISNF